MLLAFACTANAATPTTATNARLAAFGRVNPTTGANAPPYSPYHPLAVAQRDLQGMEASLGSLAPQSPERKALEERAAQLRAKIDESFVIFGPGIQKPGLYPAKPGLTVSEAIKLAGGMAPDAAPDLFLTFAIPHARGLKAARLNWAGKLEPEPPFDPALAPRRGQPGAGVGPPGGSPTTGGGGPAGPGPRVSYDFTIAAGDLIRTSANEFTFSGGIPRDFLDALDAHFVLDFQGHAVVPPELAEVKVPRIRVANKNPGEILNLYNALSEGQPALGRWRLEGTAEKPDLLALFKSRPMTVAGLADGQPLRAKAVSLGAVRQSQWEKLPGIITDSVALLAQKLDAAEAEKFHQQFGGSVQVNTTTRMLLIIGSPAYIEFVESVLAAEQANNPRQF